MTTPASTVLGPVTFGLIGSTPVPISPAGAGLVNVFNGDIKNTLLVSPNRNPAPSNSIPVYPLTNGTINGASQLWAAAETGTCANVSVGSATQISASPASIAAQIALAGVPAIVNPVVIYSEINFNLGAHGSQDFGQIPVTGTSYIFSVQVTPNAGVTVPFYTAVITQYNANGIEVDQTIYDLPMGANNLFTLKGPVYGTTFDVVINNSDTNACTVNLIGQTTNLFFTEHTIETETFTSVVSGYVLPTHVNPPKNLLAMIPFTALGAGANSSLYILPPFVGQVQMSVMTNTLADPMVAELWPLTADNNYVGVNGVAYWQGKTDAVLGQIFQQVTFPRTPMLFGVTNTGAASASFGAIIYVAQPS